MLRIQKFNNYFIAGLFLLTCFLPLLSVLLGTRLESSVTELRRLSPLPDAPTSTEALKAFPREFERFYQDHFGFRQELAELYHQARFRLGDLPSRRAIRGKQNWLFANDADVFDALNDYRNINLYSEPALKRLFVVLKSRQLWLAERGIEYVLVIAPNKSTIYPEMLPDYITRVGEVSALDQVLAHNKRMGGVNILDLRPSLLERKQEGEYLYHKVDTHWNYLGAGVAQEAVIDAISDRLPELSARYYGVGDFDRSTRFFGDLATMVGLHSSFEDIIYTRKTPFCTEPVPWDEQPSTFTTHCPQGKYSALVFRDSFFNHLQPFISEYFATATYLWRMPTLAAFENLTEALKPDIVIEQWVERSLPRAPRQKDFIDYYRASLKKADEKP